MSGLETNVFPITNLGELSSRYRLYRIKGLHPEQAEYHQNRSVLARRLSYEFRTPAAVLDNPDGPRLVLREDAAEPPSPYHLVRRAVYFDRLPGTFDLDYTLRTPENDEVCLRFLQFMLQAPLNANARLWQPGSGKPFFDKEPAHEQGNAARHTGFAVRAVLTPGGGMGLCIDVRHKLVSKAPLPVRMTRQEFRRLRGRHCVYRFGHRWYDVQLHEFDDLTVTEAMVPDGDGHVTLLDYILRASQKPIPQELADLPHDASVIHYLTNQGEARSAPAGLCYPVIDTQGGQGHRATILHPFERRELIAGFVSRHLRSLRFGDTTLRVADRPLKVPERMFPVPDFKFGGGKVLSARSTPGATHVSLDNLGRARAQLLRDRDAGFFVQERLGRQYLLLPKSVHESFGGQFIADLTRAVNELYPQGGGYTPVVIPYNDRGPRTFVDQGNAILAAAQEHCTKPGYALVMAHHVNDRRLREHDQLAALVIRRFRDLDVWAAVNHSAMGHECYELAHGRGGEPFYRVRQDKRGKFSGYLRNVALNKVLLTNEKWPFVLATPLHADLTVGIDVKQNTAGFTIVNREGNNVRTVCGASSQKEKLLSQQVKKHFSEIVRKEAGRPPAKTIVVHRDGRLWQSERDGLAQAMEALKAEGTLPPDATLTVLEVSKSSPAPLRLFDVTGSGDRRDRVQNPQVGFHHLHGRDGYVCATGRAFPRDGTVNPLHVRLVEGPLPIEKCLEDLYALTALAWTRPEDCTRYPITLKLTDRRLGEDASAYDADALEFEEAEEASV
jgi:hypothetical protein